MSRDENIISDILVRAATIVLVDGWTQGAMWRDLNGRLISASFHPIPALECVSGSSGEGAVYIAALELCQPDARFDACEAVSALLGGSFWKFNDAPGRTAEEVADLLLRAAEAAS